MLLAAGDDRAHAIRNERDLGGGSRVVGCDLQRHGDGQFARSAFDDANKTMARTVFARPGIIVQFTELPGAERLHRHKVGQQQLAILAIETGLQYIASSQVTLRAHNRWITGGNLEESSLL